MMSKLIITPFASRAPRTSACAKPGARIPTTIKKKTEQILCPFLWLGKRYGNITFEDDSLDFDISEIESLYTASVRE